MYALSAGATPIWNILVLPVIAFVILFGTYAIGMMGGGDVKLLVALMPLIGFQYISQFALQTIFFGGLVALAVLIHSKAHTARGENADDNPPTVLYGVAIAAGASTVGPIWSKFLVYLSMIF